MNGIEFELRSCVRCEVKYLEDCPAIEIEIGGKPVLPERCWRKALIKLTQKPHIPDDILEGGKI